MFLNDTLLVLMHTVNIMSSIPNETVVQNSVNPSGNDVTTTTLSPEERLNTFELADSELSLVSLT